MKQITDDQYLEGFVKHHADDELEIDDGVIVSAGADKGAWVLCWKWVTDEEAKGVDSNG